MGIVVGAKGGNLLGELQLQVMEVIWNRGSATASEVHEALSHRQLAYTTVLSTLRNLEKREYLTHTAEGRAHRFEPLISREEHTRARVQHLISTLFDDSPSELVSHLLGEGLKPAEAERIRELLASIDDREEEA